MYFSFYINSSYITFDSTRMVHQKPCRSHKISHKGQDGTSVYVEGIDRWSEPVRIEEVAAAKENACKFFLIIS